MPQIVSTAAASAALAESVDPDQVMALMLARKPDIFDDPAKFGVFQQCVAGIATEVANVVGPAPADWVRDSALWAITLGSAALIEEALFPEQQLGDASRAQQLQKRYLGVLTDLRKNAPSTGGRGASVRTQRLSSSTTAAGDMWDTTNPLSPFYGGA